MRERGANSGLEQEPGLEAFEAMAQDAYLSIPGDLRRHVDGVVIRVADFPDGDTIGAMGLKSPFDLLGLYQGISIERKSITYPQGDVDMIFLYRRPILAYWQAMGGDLAHIVRHVLIHEIGHHFGFSDDDMERLEAQR